MTAGLDQLLRRFETGHLSRRELLGASAGSINHICFGVESFDADAVLKTLTDRGVKTRSRQRGDTRELYMTDPDGIFVQLQDTKYVGGTGVLGDKKL